MVGNGKRRRVLILCGSPREIKKIKKHYRPLEGDEEHFVFNFNDALEWIIFSGILEAPPDLLVVDLEDEKCNGHQFSSEAKGKVPEVVILGVRPSQKNEP